MERLGSEMVEILTTKREMGIWMRKKAWEREVLAPVMESEKKFEKIILSLGIPMASA